MSSKSDITDEHSIRIYEETNERRSIWGKFKGYDLHIEIENESLVSFEIDNDHLVIELSGSEFLPNKFSIWGDAVVKCKWDKEGLEMVLKGGHIVTEDITTSTFKYCRVQDQNKIQA
jgi:hypothetical protein